MTQQFISLLQYCVVFYIVLTMLFYLLSDFIIFQPPQPPRYHLHSNIQFVTLANGGKIATTYYENPHSKYTLLYSHGNAEDLGTLQAYLYYYFQRGYSILAYDYEGYGLSSGKASEQNVYQNVEAVFKYMQNDLGISADRIIVHGSSLGSGPSVHLASRHKVAGLILEAPFVSTYRVKTRFPLIPFDKFVNIKKISQVKAPLLIIHGKRDTIVPFWHGQKLMQAANRPKTFFEVEYAGHNNLIQVSGAAYWQTIETFVNGLNHE